MDPAPLHGVSNNVTGGTGNGRHNRAPAAAQTVEQRGLTHIRASDQHDLGHALARHGSLYITDTKGLRDLSICPRCTSVPINTSIQSTYPFDSVSPLI